MKRAVTLLTVVVDQCVAAALVLVIPLVVFSLLWLVQDGMTSDMGAYGSAAASLWLLSNLVPLHLSVDISGLVGSAATVDGTVDIVPLALTAIFVGLGFRSGLRVSGMRSLIPAWLLALASVEAWASAMVHWAAAAQGVRVGGEAWVLPLVVYWVPFVIGGLVPHETEETEPPRERAWVGRMVAGWLRRAASAMDGTILLESPARAVARTVGAGVAALLGLTALGVLVAIIGGWMEIVTLFDSLHGDAVGILSLAVLQLAYLPNYLGWGLAWLSGAGFAFGAGSSIGPWGTQTGPLPALPVLGALPPTELAFGFVGLAAPLLAAALAVMATGRMLPSSLASMRHPWRAWAVCCGVVALIPGICGGAYVWLSSGGIGIGRLTDIGANGWVVAGLLFVEFAVVVFPSEAVLLRRRLRSIPESAWISTGMPRVPADAAPRAGEPPVAKPSHPHVTEV